MKKFLFLSMLSACICINETDAVTYSHGTQPVTTDIQGYSITVNVDFTKPETKEEILTECKSAAQIDLVIVPGIEKLSPELFEQFFGESNVDMLKAKVKSIVIPDSVTDIGDGCFKKWENLSTVSFGSSSQLERIGEYAFANSGLTEISIPDSVTDIGYGCFNRCYALTKVNFSNRSQLERIGEHAFTYSNLREISIPDSVTEIGYGCFSQCFKLASVSFGNRSQLKRIKMGLLSQTLPNTAKVYGLSPEKMDSLGIPKANRPAR